MNKHLIIFIVATVAMLSLLFLPFVSAFGFSESYYTIVVESSSFGDTTGAFTVIALLAGLGILAGSILKNQLVTLISSGTATLSLIIAIACFEQVSFLGFGVWFALIAFIACGVLSFVLTKPAAPKTYY